MLLTGHKSGVNVTNQKTYSLSDSGDIAKKVFEGTKYQASDEEIAKLANNITLLRRRGLEKLNSRLLDGGRKIWDTFSEHNFAATLLNYHPEECPISYEPPEFQRPPDFTVLRDGLSYWIQMKRSSKLEAENRHDKLVAEIRRGCEDIKIPKFFGLELSEEFKNDDIKGLLSFIGKKASSEDGEFCFPDSESQKARVKFWLPSKANLTYLTLGFDGDMGFVNVTGLAEAQIRNGFIKAAGAFEKGIDSKNINLIAIDLQGKNDIDICDAIFGTEFDYFQGDHHRWSRKNDGFFHNNDFRSKVAGIIGLRRKEQTPVSDYYLMLFVSDDFKDRFEDMNKLLPFNKIVYRHMRPPMGSGYFEDGRNPN